MKLRIYADRFTIELFGVGKIIQLRIYNPNLLAKIRVLRRGAMQFKQNRKGALGFAFSQKGLCLSWRRFLTGRQR